MSEPEYVDCICGHPASIHDTEGCAPQCGCRRPGPATNTHRPQPQFDHAASNCPCPWCSSERLAYCLIARGVADHQNHYVTGCPATSPAPENREAATNFLAQRLREANERVERLEFQVGELMADLDNEREWRESAEAAVTTRRCARCGCGASE